MGVERVVGVPTPVATGPLQAPPSWNPLHEVVTQHSDSADELVDAAQ